MSQQKTKPKPLPKELAVNEHGLRNMVNTQHGFAYFQGFAVPTGDALYKGTNREGIEFSAIVLNPNAVEHQQAHLVREGLR